MLKLFGNYYFVWETVPIRSSFCKLRSGLYILREWPLVLVFLAVLKNFLQSTFSNPMSSLKVSIISVHFLWNFNYKKNYLTLLVSKRESIKPQYKMRIFHLYCLSNHLLHSLHNNRLTSYSFTSQCIILFGYI